ncbi:MAG: aminomethyl-transferring glycine dehydrogenase subunit GcvPB [Clostridioides sp.]|jgi:glycine dehydrogenase subunit 2|nr:aminomethyl-transferring glycine dehydrogenase subunit GcvPB [Clostridioides sp.]
MKLLKEISVAGRKAYRLPELEVPNIGIDELLPENLRRTSPAELPELNEVDVVRHYTNLSNKNFGVDTGFYPLGSCTMKYNPKINEDMAALSKFKDIHPYQPEETVQGALELMYKLGVSLAEITGMDKVTLQPSAGAHGELTGLMLIKQYHNSRNDSKRTKIIVPDSAHGTNPASAAVAGFEVVEVKSHDDGSVCIDSLKEALGDDVAGLMLTNPSTLGIFERHIEEIATLVHEAGGLLYYDGANMNAIMGKTRPGDMGFDVIHLNLHKTFSTPHGGGGPGAGPVGVKNILVPFLPVPVIEKEENGCSKKSEKYVLDYNLPQSIGKVKNFYGNFGVLIRAYAYILTMGAQGLKEASEVAVLNANYIKEGLRGYYVLPISEGPCKHEVLFDGLVEPNGVTALDIAKRLLDFGYHPPTIYFPLLVHEAMMVEPTETESVETIDKFVEAMITIANEAKETPEVVISAPHNTYVNRLDETGAARKPILTWK